MNRYQNGKIYKICSFSNPELVYFGSTCQLLSKRFAAHKKEIARGKNLTSKVIIDLKDAYIVLVEAFPCNSKEELFKREAEYITSNRCVNKSIPYVSPEQQLENMKRYLEKNKERIKAYDKDRHQKWYQNSKDHVAKKYQENKEKIQSYRKEKIKCDCGTMVMRTQMSRHKGTSKHLSLLVKLQKDITV